MTDEHDDTTAFRGARFTGADFTGATFRDCDLREVKVVDSWLVDVNVSGLVGNVVVNDVDVTAFVEAELDRRHPERAQLREMQTADDYRAMWDTIERLWSDTVARARRLPEPADTSGSTTSGRSSRRCATWCSPRTPGRVARCSTSRCRTTGSATPHRLSGRGRGGDRYRPRRTTILRRGDRCAADRVAVVRRVVDA